MDLSRILTDVVIGAILLQEATNISTELHRIVAQFARGKYSVILFFNEDRKFYWLIKNKGIYLNFMGIVE